MQCREEVNVSAFSSVFLKVYSYFFFLFARSEKKVNLVCFQEKKIQLQGQQQFFKLPAAVRLIAVITPS